MGTNKSQFLNARSSLLELLSSLLNQLSSYPKFGDSNERISLEKRIKNVSQIIKNIQDILIYDRS